MAASTTVFSTTPLLGLSLGAVATSTPAMPLLTRVTGNNGHEFLYVVGNEAVGSVTTCIISASGSASTDSGSAGWTANVPSGAAAGQYFWVQRTTLA